MKKEHVTVTGGSVRIEPDCPIVAGSLGQWDFRYTAGPGGLGCSGAVRFEIPYGFSTPQTLHATCPGFVAVSTSAEAELSLHLGDPRADGARKVAAFGCLVYVQVEAGQLHEGQSLTLHYGWSGQEGLHGGAEVRYFDGLAEFPVGVDLDGRRSAPKGGFELLNPCPTLAVVPDRPASLGVVVPSIHEADTDPKPRIVARDRHGNVRTDLPEPAETSLQPVDLPAIAGRAVRVVARDPGGKLIGRSNPSAERREGEPNLYWGDLHVMTGVSAGLGPPADALRYARDCSLLDFSSVNDGDDCEQYFSDEEWHETRQAVRDLYEPGRFVTFLGSEYHERKVAGDKNIVYRDDNAPLLRWSDLPGEQPEALWQALAGRKALTIPHHTTSGSGMYRPFDFRNDEYQRLVEIYSVWGNSECAGCDRPNFWSFLLNWDNSVQSALNRGLRLGIVASSDSHDGRPGNSDWLRLRRGVFNGFTAVWAPELTRNAVFDALFARRCYATTGSRILLRFSANAQPMGSELQAEETREFHVEAIGTDRIAEVVLIRNGEPLHTRPADSEAVCLDFCDDEPFETVARTGDDGRPFVYYYVRVRQADGELAWSSPVWFG